MQVRQVDTAKGTSRAWLTKYASPEAFAAGIPYRHEEIVGNIFLNEGINWLIGRGCSDAGTKMDATHTFIGVGNGTAAAAANQTGLQGATKLYKAVDSAPIFGTNQKITCVRTFGASEANFAWEEWTVAIAPDESTIQADDTQASCVNLNRKQENRGTKASPEVWQFTTENLVQ